MQSVADKGNEHCSAPLLCLGTARTGTASLAEALHILGVNKIHHGLKTSEVSPEWDVLDRATDATFPILPTYTGKPFSRQEWDQWCGNWDVVTDIASFFATSLIPAYPDAKVIIVEREFESWFQSWTAACRVWAGSPTKLRMMESLERRTSIKPGIVTAKFYRGWVGSMDPKDLFDKEMVRKAYQRHYAYIRETVPADQLLDFKLSDGWAPLCDFLNKPVPDQPFPHVNESRAFQEFVREKRKEGLKRLAKTFLPGGRRKVEWQNQREADALMEQSSNLTTSGSTLNSNRS